MRIRTIKPQFFFNDELYQLEIEEHLPIRLAYIGLWCAADREGRFKDEPKKLKAQILPYDDDVDFSRVLHALATRGFVVMYMTNDCRFWVIPTFKTHQFVNNREAPSVLPDPSECQLVDACLTRASREDDACLREGKGRELNISTPSSPPKMGNNVIDEEVEAVYQAYPRKVGRGAALRAIAKALKVVPFAELLEAVTAYSRAKNGCESRYIPHPSTWFNEGRWTDDRKDWYAHSVNKRNVGVAGGDKAAEMGQAAQKKVDREMQRMLDEVRELQEKGEI